MVWILVAVAALFCVLALHPFITYPLSLRLAATAARAEPAKTEEQTGPVAILFCAYNEEAVIGEKLRNCMSLQADTPDTLVLVYTDGCSDRTVEIVREVGGSAVQLFEGRERHGKSFGMNILVQAARAQGAEVLFFTDANVTIDSGAIRAVRRSFNDPSVGCVTGHLHYVNPDDSATALVGAHYWSADEALKMLETRTGSCMGADGSIFSVRAKLFREVPENIMDDFYTSMSILCDGWRCVYTPDVIAYERSATASSEEYRRKVRIACRAFNCHRLLWPRLRRMSTWNIYKYVSHKLLRWVMAFSLACAGLAVAAALLVAQVSWETKGTIAVLALLGVLAVSQLPGSPWSYVRQAVLAITATGIGVLKSLQGERFQTWSVAATTRQLPLQRGSDYTRQGGVP